MCLRNNSLARIHDNSRSCLGNLIPFIIGAWLICSPSEFKMMGVTPPISTEPPKPSDVQASESKLADPTAID